jgi:hypothetical protein
MMPHLRWTSPLVPALVLAAVAGACSATPMPRPAPSPDSPFAGFDASRYPGDDAMRTWISASPYRWVGYYLPAPCRRDASWSGTRQRLEQMGWRVAVLYVGQQAWDGARAVVSDSATSAGQATSTTPPPACTRDLLLPSQGSLEGLDAVTRAAQDGFARGSTIYLDIEPMDSVSTRMRAYYRAWVRALAQDGRYRPGFYVHHRNAAALHDDLRALYAELQLPGAPPFWVARPAAGFSVANRPADSGFPFATVWQGRLNVSETHGGVTLLIDANVAAGTP